VFQAPPEGFMGESGQPIALDPTTGEELGTGDGRVLGEFDGVVLRTDSDVLTGTRGTGDPDWRIPLDDLGAGASADDLTAAPLPESAPGLVLLSTGDGTGDDGGPLIDLGSGAVLSERARDAARDPGSGTTALLDAEGLTLLDGEGDEQLAMSVSEQTELEAVVGVLVYLRDGSAVRVHNGVTGGIAQAYAQDGEGRVAVPVRVTAEGTGTLAVGGTTLLATSRIADDQD
jgi:hypothetical protein